MSFDTDTFVGDCHAANADGDSTKAMREVVARAVTRSSDITRVLGTPKSAGIQKLHVSDDLTVINVIWGPGMTIRPHNHNMWAVIGVYGGREDNIFWRRVKDHPNGLIEAAGAKSLGPADVRPLGSDIIHSVTNPTQKLTGAIHVYGGDFFAHERSEWDADDLFEHPYDVDETLRIFERSNAVAAALQ